MLLLGIGIVGLTATTKNSGISFSPVLYKAGSLLAPLFYVWIPSNAAEMLTTTTMRARLSRYGPFETM